MLSTTNNNSLFLSNNNFKNNVSSNSRLKHNISSNTRSNNNISSNSQSNNNTSSNTISLNNENLKSNFISNNVFKESSINNKIINPGFIKISSNQSINIPVTVKNESQIVYISIFVMKDNISKICIANKFQINCQLIEIKKNSETKEYYLELVKQKGMNITRNQNALKCIILVTVKLY